MKNNRSKHHYRPARRQPFGGELNYVAAGIPLYLSRSEWNWHAERTSLGRIVFRKDLER